MNKTMEEMIKQILDQLADTESQIDVLHLQKRDLLDQVKIPEEIQAIQDKIGQRKREYGQGFERLVASLDEEKAEQLAQIVIPAEIQKVFEQVQQQRKEVENKIEERKQSAYQSLLNLQKSVDEEMGEQVKQVFAEVAQRKSEIEAEFGEQEERAKDNAESLIAKAKNATEEYGETVRGAYRMAVYTKGRTTWTTDILDDIYFRLNELIKQVQSFVMIQDELSGVSGSLKRITSDMSKARKVGKPSVSIRKI
jgi:hypothetical protein